MYCIVIVQFIINNDACKSHTDTQKRTGLNRKMLSLTILLCQKRIQKINLNNKKLELQRERGGTDASIT